MSYTRLTKRTKDGTPCIISDCEDTKKCKALCLDYDCPVARVVERLAELEDKIEQGTLIELPCKVGDTIYHVNSLTKKITEFVVTSISVGVTEYTTKLDFEIHFKEKETGESRFYYLFYSSNIGKFVFLTREEAEKRLEELKK